MNTRIPLLMILVVLGTGAAVPAFASPVASTRYAPDVGAEAAQNLFAGETTVLESLAVRFERLEPGKRIEHSAHDEILYLVRTGNLSVSVESRESEDIGPAGIALIMPGDRHVLANQSDTTTTYYAMHYRSKAPADFARGAQAGGSLVVDFEKLEFQPHDRGG